jgi:hypothetical protein
MKNLSLQAFAMDLQRIFSQNKSVTTVTSLWIGKGGNTVIRKFIRKDKR